MRGIVFDMDGVLFDSERITRMMWRKAGDEFGVKDVSSAVNAVTGRSFADTCVYLKEIWGEDFPAERFRTRCSELFHAYVDENSLPLMPYAHEILEYLSLRGYPLALASSTRTATVYRELEEASLLGFFKAVVCGDMVAHSKPDPEIYLTACSRLGIAPEECLAVEDSPNGILSACGAGMKAVMVVDQIKPTQEIKDKLYKLCSSLEELKSFL